MKNREVKLNYFRSRLGFGASICISLLSPSLRGADIASLTVKADSAKEPEITLFLHLPPQAKDGKPIQGTICYCTWQKDPDSIRGNMAARTGTYSYLIDYADGKGMAVMTWTTASLWSINKNYDAYSPKEYSAVDSDFAAVAMAWESGFLQLANKYGLPKEDLLISGMSRGAQWAHRLVMEKPNRFLAIHSHISSSYAKPVPGAQSVFWLVTTGQSERGFLFASSFYHDCKELAYPIVYKAESNLGHEGSPLSRKLELEFFDYALSVKAKIKDSLGKDPDDIRMGDFKAAPFTGDFLNNIAVATPDCDMIPESQRVPLPTRAIAQAWGPILK